jgi:hypothetical protein
VGPGAKLFGSLGGKLSIETSLFLWRAHSSSAPGAVIWPDFARLASSAATRNSWCARMRVQYVAQSTRLDAPVLGAWRWEASFVIHGYADLGMLVSAQ